MADANEGKKKILIIEDEKPMARALGLKLTHSGYDAKLAFNGVEAKALLESEEFDMILSDLMMPKMDGFAVLTYLGEKKSKTPVVILTNLSQPEDEKRAKSLGAKGFYVKSNTPIANIVEMVRKMLKEV